MNQRARLLCSVNLGIVFPDIRTGSDMSDGPFICPLEDATDWGLDLVRSAQAYVRATIHYPDFQRGMQAMPFRQSTDRDNWSTNLREKLMKFASERGWNHPNFRSVNEEDIFQEWRERQNGRNRDDEVQVNFSTGPDAIFETMDDEYMDLARVAMSRYLRNEVPRVEREDTDSGSDALDSDSSGSSDFEFSDSDWWS
ncbi:hypothetical protein QC761_700555 [Podospora bellae-mahoneyi]|uniref:Uncharacterized protein n=1 Tax=Podospora bellae-mahoneyi TaxID=2093777 RepID=A0ABR0F7E1_9PEZI|nr:hypothetical protein QC761_700555 [Podospora bellae-mahoneyi]